MIRQKKGPVMPGPDIAKESTAAANVAHDNASVRTIHALAHPAATLVWSHAALAHRAVNDPAIGADGANAARYAGYVIHERGSFHLRCVETGLRFRSSEETRAESEGESWEDDGSHNRSFMMVKD